MYLGSALQALNQAWHSSVRLCSEAIARSDPYFVLDNVQLIHTAGGWRSLRAFKLCGGKEKIDFVLYLVFENDKSLLYSLSYNMDVSERDSDFNLFTEVI